MSSTIQSITRMLRDSVLLLPAFLGPGLLNVIAVVIFARILGPADYGILAVVQTTALVIAGGAGQWIRQSTLRYLPQFAHEGRASIVFVGIIALLLVTATVLLLTAAVVMLVTRWGWASPGWPHAQVLAIALYSIASLAFDNVMAYHQAALQMGLFTRLRIVGHLAAFACALALVWFIDATVVLVLWGYIIGLTATAVIGLLLVKRPHSSSADNAPPSLLASLRTITPLYLQFGLPMGLWTFLVSLLNWSDRWLLGALSSTKAAGIYTSIYAVTALAVGLVFTPLLNSLHAHTMQLWASNEHAALSTLYTTLAKLYVHVGLILFVCVLAWGDWLVKLTLGAEYSVYPGLSALLYLGILLWQFALLTHKGLEATGQVGIMVKLVAAAVIVNAILNLMTIPRWGVYAAAVNTIIGFGCYLVCVIRPARHSFGWQIPVRSVIMATLAATTTAAIYALLAMPWQADRTLPTYSTALFAILAPVGVLVYLWLVGELQLQHITRLVATFSHRRLANRPSQAQG